MSPITAHVLDTALGQPARGLVVRLDSQDAQGGFQTLASAVTDSDGRVRELLAPGSLRAGTYRVTFETEAYLRAQGRPVFYPRVEVLFCVEAPDEHYHIPLLLSPFGYSTYRGS
jgi:5-hydroxyisourate hydrolase